MKITPAFLSKAVVFALSLFIAASASRASEPPPRFKIGEDSFLLDGKPFVIRCGEIHLARVPPEYWRQRLQMCRAMGLNAVCAYIFWNFHESEPGKFDWSDWRDAAEFCRIAQEEGLWVILRPGPYVCAEWEMGGLPWWFLKKDANTLRTRDPDFMAASRTWLQEVGGQLAPLQITHGGPILMVQVENEYGYFGNDATYIKDLRQALIDAGFNVPFFACNPPWLVKTCRMPGILPVVNFGKDAPAALKSLRDTLPTGPLMCGEFYPGWFDSWGEPHHTGGLKNYLSDLEYMLKNKVSFSIYMAHGGTSFGLWAGAIGPKPGNLAYRPDTTSYDYDAPITEAGWQGIKFQATRELFSRYLPPDEKLPEPPPRPPVIAIPTVTLKEVASLFANLPAPIADSEPRSMEKYDQGHGCILYRTTLPAGPAGTLRVGSVHDFAWVYLNGIEVGRMDRPHLVNQLALPARTEAATLDILVEAMGRINFSKEIHDRKGLQSPVTMEDSKGAKTLKNWQIYNFDLRQPMLEKLKWEPAVSVVKQPSFWRGEFQVAQTGDTFLNVESWGKGVVWINGQCLGRFWNIGPTQTLYLPGPWLKKGRNEIVILDLIGPKNPTVSGQSEPVLNRTKTAQKSVSTDI